MLSGKAWQSQVEGQSSWLTQEGTAGLQNLGAWCSPVQTEQLSRALAIP